MCYFKLHGMMKFGEKLHMTDMDSVVYDPIHIHNREEVHLFHYEIAQIQIGAKLLRKVHTHLVISIMTRLPKFHLTMCLTNLHTHLVISTMRTQTLHKRCYSKA